MKKKVLIIIAVVSIICAVGAVIYFNFFRNKIDFGNQWALYNYGKTINDIDAMKNIDIDIEKAWKITKGEKNVVVAVIDSGIDPNNKYIANNIFVNSNEKEDGIDNDNNGFIDDISGWNFVSDKNDIYEGYVEDFHGNYVSSIICANFDEGMRAYYGVAPNVTILPIKSLEQSTGSFDDIISAIDYAHLMGADIVNCSWCFDDYYDELYNTMKKYDDMLFVCAAGTNNINVDKDGEVYPAMYDLDNIVSVMAIDGNGGVYDCSGYGTRIDVAAPGVNVECVFPENDFVFMDGTSVSAGYVSGIASLMLSVNDSLKPSEIIQIMKESTKKIENLNGMVSTGGVINAYKCVKKAK